MKGLVIIGLGLAIWALSLLWPDINRMLNETMMLESVIGLGLVMLAYEVIQHFVQHHNNPQTKNQHHSTNHQHNSHPVARVSPR
jgi:hypothetical protein